MDPTVAIVIVNWNGWRDTIECLESIWRVTYPNYWVVLVDNGSSDDSLAKMNEYCNGKIEAESHLLKGKGPPNKPVTMFEIGGEDAFEGVSKNLLQAKIASNRRLVLIKNEKNLGFASGSNMGISFALDVLDSKYVLLLNNDTVVDPGFLTELVRAGESDKRIGVLGPKMYYYDYQGRSDVILYAGARIVPWREIVYKHVGDGEIDKGQYDVDVKTDWCSGAGMMIRESLARQLKLNTIYHFGNEDVEYCIKAKKLGWEVAYVHNAKLWHKVGASWAKTERTIRRSIFLYFRFISSNFSLRWYAYHVLLFLVVVLPRWMFMYLAFHGDRRTLANFVHELRDFVR